MGVHRVVCVTRVWCLWVGMGLAQMKDRDEAADKETRMEM